MFSPRRLALPAVLLTLMACGEQTTDPVPGDSQIMPSASTSQSAISGGIPSRAEDYGSRWREMSDGDFWSYISEYDSTVVVGVKSPNESRGVWREHILVSPAERGDAEQSIENISGVEILSRDTLLPVLHAKVLGQDALHTLRALGSVDYVEPNRMNMSLAGESGCDWPSKAAPNQTTASGDLLDLRYTAQDAQIDRAWRRSNGEGVTVGLTDTGIHEYQLEMVVSSEFTSGESTGRFLRLGSVIAAKDGHPEWHGDCSHGTRTAGVVAAPMNGKRTVGVAWKSNLVSIRQANEVWGVWGVSVWTLPTRWMPSTRPRRLIYLSPILTALS